MTPTERGTTPMPFAVAPEATVAHAWPEGLPEPGFYHDVPYEVYRAWPAVNVSFLKIIATVTPKHAKAYMAGLLDNDTVSRKKGRGLHAALLEPTKFADRFPIAGLCPELLSSGKRKGEACGNPGIYRDVNGVWYCGQHNKAHADAVAVEEFLSSEDAADIDSVRQAVFAHRVVKILRQHGGTEVSAIWSRYGIPCKGRFDKLIIDSGCPDTIADLKKIQPMAGTERALQSSIANYGYDMQAEFYVEGVKALRPEKKAPLFAWIFMEEKPPYDVHPVWASRLMIQVGRIKVEKAIKLYRWCLDSGQWPGYAEDITEIDPADYELKRYGLAQ